MPRLYSYLKDGCKCNVCEELFKFDEIHQHIKTEHPNEAYSCIFCKTIIADEEELKTHRICRKLYNNDPNYIYKQNDLKK